MSDPFYGRPGIIRMLNEQPGVEQTGPLFRVPFELRELIYAYLLSPSWENDPPKHEGIQPTILRTCRQLAYEASDFLYSVVHVIRYSPDREPHWRPINSSSLRFLHNLVVRLDYSTLNRGECEQAVQHVDRVAGFTEGIMLTLQHSRALQTLHVDLRNLNQRKLGRKRMRSAECMNQMKDILWPFAYLPVSQKVTVGGFDTIAFVDMFNEMRRVGASREFVLDLKRGEVRYGIV